MYGFSWRAAAPKGAGGADSRQPLSANSSSSSRNSSSNGAASDNVSRQSSTCSSERCTEPVPNEPRAPAGSGARPILPTCATQPSIAEAALSVAAQYSSRGAVRRRTVRGTPACAVNGAQNSESVAGSAAAVGTHILQTATAGSSSTKGDQSGGRATSSSGRIPPLQGEKIHPEDEGTVDEGEGGGTQLVPLYEPDHADDGPACTCLQAVEPYTVLCCSAGAYAGKYFFVSKDAHGEVLGGGPRLLSPTAGKLEVLPDGQSQQQLGQQQTYVDDAFRRRISGELSGGQEQPVSLSTQMQEQPLQFVMPHDREQQQEMQRQPSRQGLQDAEPLQSGADTTSDDVGQIDRERDVNELTALRDEGLISRSSVQPHGSGSEQEMEDFTLADVTLQIEHQGLSAVHARIWEDPERKRLEDRLNIEDLSSKEGTWKKVGWIRAIPVCRDSSRSRSPPWGRTSSDSCRVIFRDDVNDDKEEVLPELKESMMERNEKQKEEDEEKEMEEQREAGGGVGRVAAASSGIQKLGGKKKGSIRGRNTSITRSTLGPIVVEVKDNAEDMADLIEDVRFDTGATESSGPLILSSTAVTWNGSEHNVAYVLRNTGVRSAGKVIRRGGGGGGDMMERSDSFKRIPQLGVNKDSKLWAVKPDQPQEQRHDIWQQQQHQQEQQSEDAHLQCGEVSVEQQEAAAEVSQQTALPHSGEENMNDRSEKLPSTSERQSEERRGRRHLSLGREDDRVKRQASPYQLVNFGGRLLRFERGPPLSPLEAFDEFLLTFDLQHLKICLLACLRQRGCRCWCYSRATPGGSSSSSSSSVAASRLMMGNVPWSEELAAEVTCDEEEATRAAGAPRTRSLSSPRRYMGKTTPYRIPTGHGAGFMRRRSLSIEEEDELASSEAMWRREGYRDWIGHVRRDKVFPIQAAAAHGAGENYISTVMEGSNGVGSQETRRAVQPIPKNGRDFSGVKGVSTDHLSSQPLNISVNDGGSKSSNSCSTTPIITSTSSSSSSSSTLQDSEKVSRNVGVDEGGVQGGDEEGSKNVSDEEEWSGVLRHFFRRGGGKATKERSSASRLSSRRIRWGMRRGGRGRGGTAAAAAVAASIRQDEQAPRKRGGGGEKQDDEQRIMKDGMKRRSRGSWKMRKRIQSSGYVCLQCEANPLRWLWRAGPLSLILCEDDDETGDSRSREIRDTGVSKLSAAEAAAAALGIRLERGRGTGDGGGGGEELSVALISSITEKNNIKDVEGRSLLSPEGEGSSSSQETAKTRDSRTHLYLSPDEAERWRMACAALPHHFLPISKKSRPLVIHDEITGIKLGEVRWSGSVLVSKQQDLFITPTPKIEETSPSCAATPTAPPAVMTAEETAPLQQQTSPLPAATTENEKQQDTPLQQQTIPFPAAITETEKQQDTPLQQETIPLPAATTEQEKQQDTSLQQQSSPLSAATTEKEKQQDTPLQQQTSPMPAATTKQKKQQDTPVEAKTSTRFRRRRSLQWRLGKEIDIIWKERQEEMKQQRRFETKNEWTNRLQQHVRKLQQQEEEKKRQKRSHKNQSITALMVDDNGHLHQEEGVEDTERRDTHVVLVSGESQRRSDISKVADMTRQIGVLVRSSSSQEEMKNSAKCDMENLPSTTGISQRRDCLNERKTKPGDDDKEQIQPAFVDAARAVNRLLECSERGYIAARLRTGRVKHSTTVLLTRKKASISRLNQDSIGAGNSSRAPPCTTRSMKNRKRTVWPESNSGRNPLDECDCWLLSSNTTKQQQQQRDTSWSHATSPLAVSSVISNGEAETVAAISVTQEGNDKSLRTNAMATSARAAAAVGEGAATVDETTKTVVAGQEEKIATAAEAISTRTLQTPKGSTAALAASQLLGGAPTPDQQPSGTLETAAAAAAAVAAASRETRANAGEILEQQEECMGENFIQGDDAPIEAVAQRLRTSSTSLLLQDRVLPKQTACRKMRSMPCDLPNISNPTEATSSRETHFASTDNPEEGITTDEKREGMAKETSKISQQHDISNQQQPNGVQKDVVDDHTYPSDKQQGDANVSSSSSSPSSFQHTETRRNVDESIKQPSSLSLQPSLGGSEEPSRKDSPPEKRKRRWSFGIEDVFLRWTGSGNSSTTGTPTTTTTRRSSTDSSLESDSIRCIESVNSTESPKSRSSTSCLSTGESTTSLTTRSPSTGTTSSTASPLCSSSSSSSKKSDAGKKRERMLARFGRDVASPPPDSSTCASSIQRYSAFMRPGQLKAGTRLPSYFSRSTRWSSYWYPRTPRLPAVMSVNQENRSTHPELSNAPHATTTTTTTRDSDIITSAYPAEEEMGDIRPIATTTTTTLTVREPVAMNAAASVFSVVKSATPHASASVAPAVLGTMPVSQTASRSPSTGHRTAPLVVTSTDAAAASPVISAAEYFSSTTRRSTSATTASALDSTNPSQSVVYKKETSEPEFALLQSSRCDIAAPAAASVHDDEVITGGRRTNTYRAAAAAADSCPIRSIRTNNDRCGLPGIRSEGLTASSMGPLHGRTYDIHSSQSIASDIRTNGVRDSTTGSSSFRGSSSSVVPQPIPLSSDTFLLSTSCRYPVIANSSPAVQTAIAGVIRRSGSWRTRNASYKREERRQIPVVDAAASRAAANFVSMPFPVKSTSDEVGNVPDITSTTGGQQQQQQEKKKNKLQDVSSRDVGDTQQLASTETQAATNEVGSTAVLVDATTSAISAVAKSNASLSIQQFSSLIAAANAVATGKLGQRKPTAEELLRHSDDEVQLLQSSAYRQNDEEEAGRHLRGHEPEEVPRHSSSSSSSSEDMSRRVCMQGDSDIQRVTAAGQDATSVSGKKHSVSVSSQSTVVGTSNGVVITEHQPKNGDDNKPEIYPRPSSRSAKEKEEKLRDIIPQTAESLHISLSVHQGGSTGGGDECMVEDQKEKLGEDIRICCNDEEASSTGSEEKNRHVVPLPFPCHKKNDSQVTTPTAVKASCQINGRRQLATGDAALAGDYSERKSKEDDEEVTPIRENKSSSDKLSYYCSTGEGEVKEVAAGSYIITQCRSTALASPTSSTSSLSMISGSKDMQEGWLPRLPFVHEARHGKSPDTSSSDDNRSESSTSSEGHERMELARCFRISSSSSRSSSPSDAVCAAVKNDKQAGVSQVEEEFADAISSTQESMCSTQYTPVSLSEISDSVPASVLSVNAESQQTGYAPHGSSTSQGTYAGASSEVEKTGGQISRREQAREETLVHADKQKEEEEEKVKEARKDLNRAVRDRAAGEGTAWLEPLSNTQSGDVSRMTRRCGTARSVSQEEKEQQQQVQHERDICNSEKEMVNISDDGGVDLSGTSSSRDISDSGDKASTRHTLLLPYSRRPGGTEPTGSTPKTKGELKRFLLSLGNGLKTKMPPTLPLQERMEEEEEKEKKEKGEETQECLFQKEEVATVSAAKRASRRNSFSDENNKKHESIIAGSSTQTTQQQQSPSSGLSMQHRLKGSTTVSPSELGTEDTETNQNQHHERTSARRKFFFFATRASTPPAHKTLPSADDVASAAPHDHPLCSVVEEAENLSTPPVAVPDHSESSQQPVPAAKEEDIIFKTTTSSARVAGLWKGDTTLESSGPCKRTRSLGALEDIRESESGVAYKKGTAEMQQQGETYGRPARAANVTTNDISGEDNVACIQEEAGNEVTVDSITCPDKNHDTEATQQAGVRQPCEAKRGWGRRIEGRRTFHGIAAAAQHATTRNIVAGKLSRNELSMGGEDDVLPSAGTPSHDAALVSNRRSMTAAVAMDDDSSGKRRGGVGGGNGGGGGRFNFFSHKKYADERNTDGSTPGRGEENGGGRRCQSLQLSTYGSSNSYSSSSSSYGNKNRGSETQSGNQSNVVEALVREDDDSQAHWEIQVRESCNNNSNNNEVEEDVVKRVGTRIRKCNRYLSSTKRRIDEEEVNGDALKVYETLDRCAPVCSRVRSFFSAVMDLPIPHEEESHLLLQAQAYLLRQAPRRKDFPEVVIPASVNNDQRSYEATGLVGRSNCSSSSNSGRMSGRAECSSKDAANNGPTLSGRTIKPCYIHSTETVRRLGSVQDSVNRTVPSITSAPGNLRPSGDSRGGTTATFQNSTKYHHMLPRLNGDDKGLADVNALKAGLDKCVQRVLCVYAAGEFQLLLEEPDEEEGEGACTCESASTVTTDRAAADACGMDHNSASSPGTWLTCSCWVRLNAREQYRLRPDDVLRVGPSLEFSLKRFLTGVASRQGYRLSMEDEEVVIQDLGVAEDVYCSYFGVYDGHGGRACAEYVKRVLHVTFRRELLRMCGGSLSVSSTVRQHVYQALLNSFLLTDAAFLCEQLRRKRIGLVSTSGCTCVVVVILGGEVWCANCGDARAILCRGGKVLELSSDHKPHRKDELERIIAAGGFVRARRVLGRLAVSRAFGDVDYKSGRAQEGSTSVPATTLAPCTSTKTSSLPSSSYTTNCNRMPDTSTGNSPNTPLRGSDAPSPLVIALPEIRMQPLCEEDEFLLLACDGLFDVFSSQEAADFVKNAMSDKPPEFRNPQVLVDALLFEAIEKRRSRDNVTAILVLLSPTGRSIAAASGGTRPR